MPATVTLAEVAERAGVSRMTVSRALNGGPVAVETRERILAAVDALGYRPNLLGRALGRNRLSVIGVLVRDLVNPFYAPFIKAIHGTARARRYLVSISESARDAEQERQWTEHVAQMRFAGLIVTPTGPTTDHLQALSESGLPVVMVTRRWAGDFVAPDHFVGGLLPTRHLARLGHRRIACIYVDEPHYTPTLERVEGYRTALREAGVEPSPALTIRAQAFDADEGARAADRLLAMRQRPTAVFATADVLALGLLARLQERGVRVPADVAIVGFDDIPHARHTTVPLTTVALPKEEMGRRAAEILLDRIDGDDGPPQQHTLTPELVVRASCGAADGPPRIEDQR